MGYAKCYTESDDWKCDFSKNGLRLPKEAEWEYACQAGTKTWYYSGSKERELGEAGWFNGNSDFITHPLGLKKPNAYGLYDMHGNVWEWCNDWYGSDYYTSSPETDPTGPDSGSVRVLRSGAWNCRSAPRDGLRPLSAFSNIGFRAVRRL